MYQLNIQSEKFDENPGIFHFILIDSRQTQSGMRIILSKKKKQKNCQIPSKQAENE